MNKIIYAVGALSFILAACEDVNEKFDGLDEVVNDSKVVVENSKEYTLTADDYATISSNYKEADAEDTAAIQSVKALKAFPDAALAQKYLPGFIADKWVQYDNQSAIIINYAVVSDGVNQTVTSLCQAPSYKLSADDYTAIGSECGYLTPSTLSKLSSIVNNGDIQGNEGDFCVVSYDYSSVEPSGSEDVSTTTWKELEVSNLPAGDSWTFQTASVKIPEEYAGQVVRLGFRYTSTAEAAGTIEIGHAYMPQAGFGLPVLFAKNSKGKYMKSTTAPTNADTVVLAIQSGDSYYVFDKIDDAKGNGYGYTGKTSIAVDNGEIAEDVFLANALTLEAADGGFYMKNSDGKYLFSIGKASFSYGDEKPAEGGVWSFTSFGEAMLVSNVAKSKTVAFSDQYKTFGEYEDNKLYGYNCSFAGSALPDGYSFVNVNLGSLTYVWKADKSFIKASAYNGAANESEAWVVSPEIDLSSVSSESQLALYMAANKFSVAVSDGFGVFITTDYTEGADFTISGNKSLKAAAKAETRYAVFTNKGSKWSEASDVIFVNPSDYVSMGTSYTSFSSSLAPDEYIPTFLSIKLPYAKDDDSQVVAYQYYDNGETSIQATEYVFNGGVWSPVVNDREEHSDRFVKTSGNWMWDPCVTINLPYAKNDPVSGPFYQAVVDYVWENIDVAQLGCTTKGQGYVTSYGNNEFFTGSSAYYGNVDWRPAKAIEQNKAAFEGMSNDEIFAKLQQNLIDVYPKVLGTLYPEADLIDGIDVIYTINFVAYYSINNDGINSPVNYTIKFIVKSKGVFEYVEGSLQIVE